ncbi:MAG: hypothetical protein BGO26_16945 [Actinobacteria bacterium 69-20]|nr:hypothetical protein [Actinomycetota bacterium]OJV27144.1 MAG: hypothetical protein BGO26_16945 [Actinobacteria bacterium 69-20]
MRTRSAVTKLVAMVTSALVLVSGCTAMTAGHPTGTGATGGSNSGSTTAPTQKPSEGNLSDVAKDFLAAVKATPWPIRSVDFAAPLTTVGLADDDAVTKTVGPAGGDVSLTASGVTYTLHLPKDALVFDTAITLTPITSIGAFKDLPDGTLHGVDMQPHGLQLAAMAQLEITGLPQQDVLGFAYTGAGFDLRPAPIVPDPDRTAVYVSHFSGGGVGPFGAVSEALKNAGLDTGPTADAARKTADIHNKKPGSSLDQLADLFTEMVGHLRKLSQAANDKCGEVVLDMDVMDWLTAPFVTPEGTRTDDKALVRGLVDTLVSCWGERWHDGCITPSPAMIRELQAIKALLIRWKALDQAAVRTGKRNIGDSAYCNGGGTINYKYNDRGSSITARIDLSFDESADGTGLLLERSYYEIGERTVGSDSQCPSLQTGYGAFRFDETPPGSEVAPSIGFNQADDDHVAMVVNPIYYVKSHSCNSDVEGWEAGLALGCSPDGSTPDSLIGTYAPDLHKTVILFECDDPADHAKTSGILILGNAIDRIIPPSLWD